MNIPTTLPLADTWGIDIGTGWVIAVVVMMVLCMGVMTVRMAWMGGGSARRGSMPWDGFMARESPMETLEHRFAAGEISVEDYRERREVLVNGDAKPNGDHEDGGLATPKARERRQR